MKLNSRGQGFEVFNLLIGAILALAILVIIISIINYVEQIKVDSSIQAINQKLKSASQSPDGSVFVAENIVVPKDYSFNSKNFSRILNIKEECVEFDFPQQATWIQYSNSQHNIIYFSKRMQTDFYVLCNTGNINYHNYWNTLNCSPQCEFCCLASFGVNPAPAN
jgi:predicted small secreted protein